MKRTRKRKSLTVPTNAIDLQKRKKPVSVTKEAASSKTCMWPLLVGLDLCVGHRFILRNKPQENYVLKSNTNITHPSGNEKENDREKKRLPV